MKSGYTMDGAFSTHTRQNRRMKVFEVGKLEGENSLEDLEADGR
jgi:hypothetical protein